MTSTDGTLRDLYEEEAAHDTPPSWYQFPEEWPKYRWEAAYRLCPGGGSVLEIGFGDGNLLYNLTRKYKIVAGVDLAEARVRVVSELCIDHDLKGVDVEQNDGGRDLLERFGENSFDCVVWTDVMEHIVDIHEMMRVIGQLVKPGGCIVTSTPNTGYFKHRLTLLRGRFPSTSAPNEGISLDASGLIDGGHVHYLTFATVERLHTIHGFTASHKRLGLGRLGRLHDVRRTLLSGSVAIRSFSPA
jgi:SAM-dependent methyltransferase